MPPDHRELSAAKDQDNHAARERGEREPEQKPAVAFDIDADPTSCSTQLAMVWGLVRLCMPLG